MSKQSVCPGRFGWAKYWMSGVLLSAALTSPATAHLMVAQRGTLNFVGDGSFVVLSLPVSAFAGTDDDGDGKLSVTEFTKHRPAIVDAVNEQVQLLDQGNPLPLQGMMLSPVVPHTVPGAPKVPADQLVVMGRFDLAGLKGATSELKFHVGLFGKQAEEQSLEITATQVVEPKKHKMVLTPKQPKARLFYFVTNTINRMQ